jgi:hypothetical protein
MTIRQDDRTKAEKATHNWLVTATDNFMSGWGQAKNGLSKCAWACKWEDLDKVEKWVRNRSEMKYVNVVNGKWYPRNAAHVHIYVVHEGHPATA